MTADRSPADGRAAALAVRRLDLVGAEVGGRGPEVAVEVALGDAGEAGGRVCGAADGRTGLDVELAGDRVDEQGSALELPGPVGALERGRLDSSLDSHARSRPQPRARAPDR